MGVGTEATMAVDWKPKKMPTLTTVLPGGRKLIDFATKVFGAKVEDLYEVPGGGVAHAELRFGESLVMTGDATPDHVLPPGVAHLYLPDCDAAYARALAAGAKAKQPPEDRPWGDRSARLIDPVGNEWSIATHVEDVSEEEIRRRMDAMMKKGAG
jgi:PhnB protein